tara:strand:+ start:267 stop:1163 length:897 start_codon:yes stop_codon:yes gene_type:complete
MVNDKNNHFIYLYILLLAAYVLYVTNENVFNETEKNQWIYSGQEDLQKFILKHKSIDAIIIGGSNSAAGISAELLSKLTNKNFYNLSESSEGLSDSDYLNTITLKTSNLDRKNIRIIIYSTIKFFSNDENRINNIVLNKQKIKFLPRRSIASIIKQKLMHSFKNYFPNNEEYGDRKITNYYDKYKTTYVFNKSLPINIFVENLKKLKKNYQKLFPNSIFIVVSPTIYNKDPEFQNNFVNELSKELLKNEIKFIPQPPISSFYPIWKDPIHLNLEGREIRTNELYKLIQNNYDFNNLFK